MTPTFQSFITRQKRLGVGISGEYGGRPSIDPCALDAEHPGLIHFYEFGTDADRGLDDNLRRWLARGRPATYHFLDLNLEEAEELDADWLARTRSLAEQLSSPWLCGDAGLWHFGPRDRGHGLLLPPILEPDSAKALGRNIRRLSEATALPVLPENPPALAFIGGMHILDYFAMVCQEADCGLLLDTAHLAIFQHSRGYAPLDGLDGFPTERIIEIHVAGGGERESADGFRYLDDDHRAQVHKDVWSILEELVPRCPNLKAVCYECEHNPAAATLDNFARLNSLFPAPGAAASAP